MLVKVIRLRVKFNMIYGISQKRGDSCCIFLSTLLYYLYNLASSFNELMRAKIILF